jgi:hypothetical protein
MRVLSTPVNLATHAVTLTINAAPIVPVHQCMNQPVRLLRLVQSVQFRPSTRTITPPSSSSPRLLVTGSGRVTQLLDTPVNTLLWIWPRMVFCPCPRFGRSDVSNTQQRRYSPFRSAERLAWIRFDSTRLAPDSALQDEAVGIASVMSRPHGHG